MLIRLAAVFVLCASPALAAEDVSIDIRLARLMRVVPNVFVGGVLGMIRRVVHGCQRVADSAGVRIVHDLIAADIEVRCAGIK